MLDEYDLVAKIRLRLGGAVIQREKMTTKLRTEVAETAGNDNGALLSKARRRHL
jgi:hypothetical protein